MADILATLALNIAGFTRGLREAERESERAKGRVNKIWGSSGAENQLYKAGRMAAALYGGTAIVTAATRAVREYADAYKELTPNIAAARSEVESFWADIGRDASHAIESLGPGGAGGFAMLREWRADVTNALADAVNFFGGGGGPGETGADVHEQRLAAERSVQAGRRQRELREARMGLAAEQLDGSGDTFGAKEARETLRHEQELRKIGQERDNAQQKALRDIENHRHASRMQGIQRERNEEAKKDEEREDSLRKQIDAERERQRLNAMTLAGDKRGVAEEQARQRVTDAFNEPLDRALEANDWDRFGALQRERRELENSAVAQAITEFDREAGEKSSAAERELARDRARYEVEKLRLQNKSKEADLLQVELEYQEKIEEVMNNQALTALRRSEAVKSLEAERDDLLALTEVKAKDSVIGGRSVESGLAIAPILAGVLGGTGSGRGTESATLRIASNSDRTVATLERIERSLQGGLVAVAG